MLGNRFRKGFLFSKESRWKKGHAKVKLIKKHHIFLNIKEIRKSYFNLVNTNLKYRSKIYRRVRRKKVNVCSRRFYGLKTTIFGSDLAVENGLKFFYKKYSYPILISQEYGKIADFHLENLRRILRKELGKHVLIWIRIKPYLIMLKRSNLVRMGGGKGAKLNKVIYPVYPGCPLIEVRGVSYSSAIKVFKKLTFKLPIKTKLFFLNLI